MKHIQLTHRAALTCIALALVSLGAVSSQAQTPSPAPGCPPNGWQENLGNYLKPDAAFPTQDTATVPTPDCNFHEWSWEAFTWATALVSDGQGNKVPRFMTLPTVDDLLSPDANAGKAHARPLKLAARSLAPQAGANSNEAASAVVEADGNMLVGQNGFPVYASVHMNESYFGTAKKNLIIDGGYQNQPADSYFDVGAAVFKATWLRLADGQTAPKGAYTTQAQVPVLQTKSIPGSVTIEPVPNQFVTVTVALVGLHVVGYTVNHPEFLWGTFEHNLNAPRVPDNTFTTNSKDSHSYTFYAGNTSYTQVNQANTPPTLKLDPAKQTLSPVTNAVLVNATGGENQPNGPGNVLSVNSSGQRFMAGQKGDQSLFANYTLDGTVWMKPNTYSVSSNQTDAVGSIVLANATAETFFQVPKNSPVSSIQNCFTCHNATSYSFQNPPPAKLANRRIAISHALAVGTPYAVSNSVTGQVTAPNVKK